MCCGSEWQGYGELFNWQDGFACDLVAVVAGWWVADRMSDKWRSTLFVVHTCETDDRDRGVHNVFNFPPFVNYRASNSGHVRLAEFEMIVYLYEFWVSTQ